MTVAANLLEVGFAEETLGTIRPLIVAWERFRHGPTLEGAESAYAKLSDVPLTRHRRVLRRMLQADIDRLYNDPQYVGCFKDHWH